MTVFKRPARASRKLALLLSAGLGLSAVTTAAHAADAPAATAPAALPKADFGTWGFDLAGRDTAAIPGDNFFKYANGTYLDKLTIPSDMTSYGP
ncbi:MAG: peptidase M13, partial [Acetobacter cibinongensis]